MDIKLAIKDAFFVQSIAEVVASEKMQQLSLIDSKWSSALPIKWQRTEIKHDSICVYFEPQLYPYFERKITVSHEEIRQFIGKKQQEMLIQGELF